MYTCAFNSCFLSLECIPNGWRGGIHTFLNSPFLVYQTGQEKGIGMNERKEGVHPGSGGCMPFAAWQGYSFPIPLLSMSSMLSLNVRPLVLCPDRSGGSPFTFPQFSPT
uniref:Uncharacterized protein n=1 Tax=Morchella importuna TaxID=1174673 RepID=A0A650AFI1_9PEZI|nr:hypothetical protein [Morchella importuna]QGN66674.1 hypothetical protein [Morchella importuna]